MQKHLLQKTKTIVFFLLFSCLLCISSAAAQDYKITGTVTDSKGEAIIGAVVVVQGSKSVTISDVEGNFSLQVSSAAEQTIEISYIGYTTTTLKAKAGSPVHAVLEENLQTLNEVIVVGYGTQKRATMTSAVAQIKGDKIAALPNPRLSTGIGGQVSGVITFQESAAPGADAATIYVRGSQPLILVDGVERPGDRIDTEDIESVSVLKDASAVAPYGLKGANGVILITTKRGAAGNFSATYTGNVSWQKPINHPEFMGSADYFEFRNKAYEMDGLPGQMTPADEIALYRDGSDPNRYPDTDWIGNYMGVSNATKHNISVTGGTDRIKVFASFGYVYQGSMFHAQDYNRFTGRANIDIQVTPTTKISVDNSFMKDIVSRDGLDASTIMERLYRAVPFEVDRYTNGLPAFQQSLGISMYEGIYHREDYSDMNDISNSNLTIEQQLSFIKGLSAKVSFNYDKQHKDLKNWIKPLIYYNLDPVTGEYDQIDQSGTVKPSLSQEYKRWDWYTFNGALNYGNSFGKHHITALALFEARWQKATNLLASKSEFDFNIPELSLGTPDQTKWGLAGTSSQEAQYGIVGRIGYDFNQKYLVELAGRYDATYKYALGRRTDFFPSFSLGWRISEEEFMPFRETINNLKLRASYGKSGYPGGEAFYYTQTYGVNKSYIWGSGDTEVREQGIYANKEPNAKLTWQTVWKSDFGFDLNMWNGLFGLEFDYYHEKRNDIILGPQTEVTAEYGISLSDENYGIDGRHGIDITLSNRTKITKDFTLNNSFVFTYTRHQTIKANENKASLYNPRRRQTGLSNGQLWGYQSAGLFADEEEIKNWAYQATGTLSGDIKYIDQNGDGKIDSEDIVHIGRSMIPEIMWGYNLRTEWKGFDLTLFFQGTGRSNYYLGTADRGVRRPFADNKARIDHYNSWTVDNPDPNAKYPRLRSTEFAMNYVISDFWVINSSYVKLKSVDLGYTLKPEYAKKMGMQNLRINANFYNVWTIFTRASKDFDPESQKFSAYPQQFISTVGITATF
ncbi:MAG: TonB-dependent receptor [Dysgonamonadaceae bacterium]|jgi:TonB-linked SusC/RagA family outer membrane protein|nr:TonB-dependent receptor [Dysgonamonadaceae bacterium]